MGQNDSLHEFFGQDKTGRQISSYGGRRPGTPDKHGKAMQPVPAGIAMCGASPSRTEIMPREIFQKCLDIAALPGI